MQAEIPGEAKMYTSLPGAVPLWEEPLHTLFCLARGVCLTHSIPEAHSRQYCHPQKR